MNKILLILFLNLLVYPCFCKNLKNREISPIEKANITFDEQNIKKCITNIYIATYDAKHSHDSLTTSALWFEAACLKLLLKQFSQAIVAYSLSEKYHPSHVAFPANRVRLFNSLQYYQHEDYRKAYETLKGLPYADFKIRHLSSLITVFTFHAQDVLRGFNDSRCGCFDYCKYLKMQKDTAWFGFPQAQYYSGDFQFIRNHYSRASELLKEAINGFESIQALNKEWALSYKRIISSFYMMDDNLSIKEYTLKFNRLFPHNTAGNEIAYIFDLIKAFNYSVKNNYKDELTVYLKLYNTADPALKITLTKYICQVNKFLQQYSEALQWYSKIPESNLSAYEDALACYCYFVTGNSAKAKAMCIKCEKEMNPHDEHYITTLEELTRYYAADNDYKNELRVLTLKLDFLKKYFNPLNSYLYYAYVQLGILQWYLNDFQSSLELFHHAIYSLLPIPYSDDLYKMPDISNSIDDQYLHYALNDKAEAFYQLSKQRKDDCDALRDLKISLVHFEKSISVIQRYKMTLPFEEQKLICGDLYKKRYPNIIEVCLELFHKTGDSIYAEKAFEYAEKSKASLLLSIIQSVNVRKMHLIPDNLIKEEDKLRTTSSLLSEKISNAFRQVNPNFIYIDQLTSLRYQISAKLDSLHQICRISFPEYYNSENDLKVIPTKKLQSDLNANEAIIQYVLNYDLMVMYVLTKNDFKIYSEKISPTFFNDIAAFRKRTSSYAYETMHDTSIRAFDRLSNRLYEHLIMPGQKYLAGKKLIIIPDDVLNQIPFEALVTKVSDSKNISYRTLNYLIREHSIAYNFSATLFGLNFKTKHVLKTQVLAMAPNYNDKNDAYVQDDTISGSKKKMFAQVKGTANEVEAIRDYFPQALIIKNKASEKQFKKIADQYDIIHLAMHGVINNEDPMASRLVFTPEKDSIDEGYLNTYEIYNLHLNSSLVVLSACNTGAGKLHPGEGIISLARGFFSAGANSIVMTLWPVADKSSSKLIGNFYAGLSNQKTIGDALREAKLRYLAEADNASTHPYLWAGYIVTGNANLTFESGKSRYWYVYLTLGASMLIIFWIIKRKRSPGNPVNLPRQ